jgi:hypothetical protein
MNKLLLSIAALSFLAACEAGAPPAGSTTPAGAAPAGAAPAAKAPGDAKGHFILRAPGAHVVEVLIDNGNITGPNVLVTRYQTATDHSLRGTAFGSAVDVAIDGRKATGIYGAGPMDLSTERREGKIHISGLVSGSMTDFDVNMKILKGRIGQCQYDLAWNGQAYEGTRGCGSNAEPVTVYVPTTLGKWSDSELGACLGVLMGQPANSTEAFSSAGSRSTSPVVPDQAAGHLGGPMSTTPSRFNN